MCGIAGSFQLDPGQPVTGDRIGDALRCLAHRGPDDEGRYGKGRAVLGHRRLSIIDTSALGHQPFTDNDGRYTIVFNGEAFNFQELRAGLEADGHQFRSHTDTEVVLRLYVLKGPAFLHDLNGFFALAIHDAEKDTLFLARDRFGVKPLHWAEVDGRFLFASELRALLALGASTDRDLGSLRQFLTYLFIPAPHSALRAAHKLSPGHALLVDAHGVKEQRWYDLVKASSKVARPADPRSKLRELLDDAVRLRLISDVPVGAFLSGGVDSSIVSALAARHHNGLHTFSIGYTDDPYFDETRYAEEVARHIGSEHSTFKLSREEMADGYVRLLNALDEPFADSSALPSFLLCERTRRQVTVALSGDGADEVFGGYRKHQAELRWRDPGAAEKAVALLAPLWRVLPRSRNSPLQDRVRQLDRFARMNSTNAGHRFLQLAAFIPPEEAEALVSGPIDAGDLKTRDALLMEAFRQMPGMNGVLLADVASTLPNDMLYKVDLTSMAHGLEVRTPFLDRRVVELAFSLPPEEKLRKGSGKHILREAFGDLVPASVMSRSKKGFEVPLLSLLRGPLQHLVDELLAPELVAQSGLDKERVAMAVRQLRSADPGHAQATVHALIVYVSWWRTHINR
ncbi:MAG: asparagine synthase (glutamine-hydrolyzing) [Flavobacteriales bacterium]|nr:asparagine synthase (glutamine-hydrolyzing) [Flavobacteriales bacterium]MCB0757654.1 asparagine synthase (glutamine-hydrolyzing) [Flavobacteriales bacterium]